MRNKNVIITIIALLILSLAYFVFSSNAENKISSRDIIYDNSKTGLTSKNVQDAIVELYGYVTGKEYEIPNTITVTFNANGGIVEVLNKSVVKGEIYGNLPTPIKKEDANNTYEFIGWYTKATNGVKVESSTSVTNSSNHTLYAIYNVIPKQTDDEITEDEKIVTIIFDVNGGNSLPDVQKNQIRTSNTTYGQLPQPTKNGYTFKGWYTVKENVTADKLVTSSTIVPKTTDTIILYANWIMNSPVVIEPDNNDATDSEGDNNSDLNSNNGNSSSNAQSNNSGTSSGNDNSGSSTQNNDSPVNTDTGDSSSSKENNKVEIQCENCNSTITIDKDLSSNISKYEEKEVSDTIKQQIKNKLFKDSQDIYIIDTSLNDKNGKELNLNGKSITYTIPLPNGMDESDNISVYQIIDGKKVELSFWIEGNKVMFVTENVGRIAIVKNPERTEIEEIEEVNNEIDDGPNVVLIIVIVIVSISIITGILIYIFKIRRNRVGV